MIVRYIRDFPGGGRKIGDIVDEPRERALLVLRRGLAVSDSLPAPPAPARLADTPPANKRLKASRSIRKAAEAEATDGR